jgi:hypothetical protein
MHGQPALGPGPAQGNAAIRVGPYKLIVGEAGPPFEYGPPNNAGVGARPPPAALAGVGADGGARESLPPMWPLQNQTMVVSRF